MAIVAVDADCCGERVAVDLLDKATPIGLALTKQHLRVRLAGHNVARLRRFKIICR
jgi:hypothetical protein